MKSNCSIPCSILLSGVVIACAASSAQAAPNTDVESLNKSIVTQFIAGIMGPQDADAVARQVAPHIIEHDPLVQSGRHGTTEWIRAMRHKSPAPAFTVKHAIADGDMVFV